MASGSSGAGEVNLFGVIVGLMVFIAIWEILQSKN